MSAVAFGGQVVAADREPVVRCCGIRRAYNNYDVWKALDAFTLAPVQSVWKYL